MTLIDIEPNTRAAIDPLAVYTRLDDLTRRIEALEFCNEYNAGSHNVLVDRLKALESPTQPDPADDAESWREDDSIWGQIADRIADEVVNATPDSISMAGWQVKRSIELGQDYGLVSRRIDPTDAEQVWVVFEELPTIWHYDSRMSISIELLSALAEHLNGNEK